MKAWIYNPHNGPPEIHLRRETVVAAMEENSDYSYFKMRDSVDESEDYIYIDEGDSASLVEVVE